MSKIPALNSKIVSSVIFNLSFCSRCKIRFKKLYIGVINHKENFVIIFTNLIEKPPLN